MIGWYFLERGQMTDLRSFSSIEDAREEFIAAPVAVFALAVLADFLCRLRLAAYHSN